MTDKEEYIDPTIKVLNKCFGISEKTVREIVEEKPNSRYVILKKESITRRLRNIMR